MVNTGSSLGWATLVNHPYTQECPALFLGQRHSDPGLQFNRDPTEIEPPWPPQFLGQRHSDPGLQFNRDPTEIKSPWPPHRAAAV